MRRVLVTALWVAVVLAAFAPAASAKGISRARFAGPGLHAHGVTVVRARWLQHTGLVSPKLPTLAALGVARDDLGSPYRARYRMDYAPRHTLRQVVYPYAEGGPITFTPRGQHVGEDHASFPGGWSAAPPRLLDLLVARGFPAEDPARSHVADAGAADDQVRVVAATADAEPARWIAWTAALGAAAALIVVAALAMRGAAGPAG